MIYVILERYLLLVTSYAQRQLVRFQGFGSLLLSPPIRPGNLLPLNTRCASTEPFEPGERWKREP